MMRPCSELPMATDVFVVVLLGQQCPLVNATGLRAVQRELDMNMWVGHLRLEGSGEHLVIEPEHGKQHFMFRVCDQECQRAT